MVNKSQAGVCVELCLFQLLKEKAHSGKGSLLIAFPNLTNLN